MVALFCCFRYPESPIFAVGFSLGASLLVKYLGEEGAKGYRPLVGAVSVSNPWDVENNTIGGGTAKGIVGAVLSKFYSIALTIGIKVTVRFGGYMILVPFDWPALCLLIRETT